MISTIDAVRKVSIQSGAPSGRFREPNIWLIDNTVIGCGTAVRMEGDTHAYVNGLVALDTPVVFDLSGGATVEAHRIHHDPGTRRRPRPAA